jgi:hypothetical protein
MLKNFLHRTIVLIEDHELIRRGGRRPHLFAWCPQSDEVALDSLAWDK